LGRLASYQQLGISDLAEAAGVNEPELQRVLDSGFAGPSLLRRLAPALGLHEADLFALADVPPPADLAPLDPGAATWVPLVAQRAMAMPGEDRLLLRQLVDSLPREARARPVREPENYERYGPDVAGALVRMLQARNLHRASGAKAMLVISNIGLSAASYATIGRGRKELTPELLIGFAKVLGISSGLLSALTGIALPPDIPAPGSPEADTADLIWQMRTLTADQVQRVYSEAQN
jgi:hypothetical protein